MSVLNVLPKCVCIFCKASQEVICYFTKSEIDVFKLFYEMKYTFLSKKKSIKWDMVCYAKDVRSSAEPSCTGQWYTKSCVKHTSSF